MDDKYARVTSLYLPRLYLSTKIKFQHFDRLLFDNSRNLNETFLVV